MFLLFDWLQQISNQSKLIRSVPGFSTKPHDFRKINSLVTHLIIENTPVHLHMKYLFILLITHQILSENSKANYQHR